MRLPFLKPPSDAGAGARAAPGADDPGGLEALRLKARRRLMGAVVLLVVAVAGFPLLFETQPRPLPGKTAGTGPSLVIKGDTAPAATAPEVAAAPVVAAASSAPAAAAAPAASPTASAAPAAAAPGAEPAASSSVPVAAAAAPSAAAVASPPARPQIPSTTAKAKPAPAASAAAAGSAASAAAAKVAKSADPAASAPAADAAVRWVVQVGAYNDMERMRLARQKAEKLGFKTYITDVDTPTGKRTRVRLGPFATKAEADAAAAKVKAAGMAANVLSV